MNPTSLLIGFFPQFQHLRFYKNHCSSYSRLILTCFTSGWISLHRGKLSQPIQGINRKIIDIYDNSDMFLSLPAPIFPLINISLKQKTLFYLGLLYYIYTKSKPQEKKKCKNLKIPNSVFKLKLKTKCNSQAMTSIFPYNIHTSLKA